MPRLLLGLPGAWAHHNREPSDHDTTKIGGLPDWPFPKDDCLDPTLLKCSLCGNSHCLIAQVYAPVSTETSQIEERFLVVLGCVTPECGSNPLSWRALRVQKVKDATEYPAAVSPEESKSATGLRPSSEASWWDNLEDEEGEDIDLEELSKAFSSAASLTPAPKKKKKNRKKHLGTASKPSLFKQSLATTDIDTPVLPCFYIYTKEESVLRKNALAYSSDSLPSVSKKVSDECQEESWAPEGYEYDKALTADRTFLKFKKQLDASPDQCFRYVFGGEPLLAATEMNEPGKCTSCGASRHFEMQLMPPLIYFLQEECKDDQKRSLDNWNWMTLLVYTCSKSCSFSSNEKSKNGGWSVLEEPVITQSEKTLEECSPTEYFK